MSVLWRSAVLMKPMDHMDLMHGVSNWPERVHVTQSGFASHFESPILRSFLWKHRVNGDAAWYRTEHVDLSQPIHSWQPHIFTRHLTKYLDNPNSDSEKVRRKGYEDGYAGDEHPTAVRHLGKIITTDGNHRVGAEMLRGTNTHMKMWVYDADKHGFRDNLISDPPPDKPKPKYDFKDFDWHSWGKYHSPEKGLTNGGYGKDWWHHPVAGPYYKDRAGTSHSALGSWGGSGDEDWSPPKGTKTCHRCDGWGCNHCEDSGHYPPPSHIPDYWSKPHSEGGGADWNYIDDHGSYGDSGHSRGSGEGYHQPSLLPEFSHSRNANPEPNYGSIHDLLDHFRSRREDG